jgi:hypothetical protein
MEKRNAALERLLERSELTRQACLRTAREIEGHADRAHGQAEAERARLADLVAGGGTPEDEDAYRRAALDRARAGQVHTLAQLTRGKAEII